jgi:DNA polymerase-4
MHRLGITTGNDLRAWSLAALQQHFGKAAGWYYGVARGQDDRPVCPNRERKSSGSETTFDIDLTDAEAIETGVVAMADNVWQWCATTGARGRTVTVKIKWADFQQATRSHTIALPVANRERLHEISLALIRSVFPPKKGIRLVGVALSNFTDRRNHADQEDLVGIALLG